MRLLLPDGGYIEVPIESMVVKDSCFVPTLKAAATKSLLWWAADEVGIKVRSRTAIVDGYLGVLLRRVG
jgi:hypothetical protein